MSNKLLSQKCHVQRQVIGRHMPSAAACSEWSVLWWRQVETVVCSQLISCYNTCTSNISPSSQSCKKLFYVSFQRILCETLGGDWSLVMPYETIPSSQLAALAAASPLPPHLQVCGQHHHPKADNISGDENI